MTVLLLSCPDRRGLVAATSGFIDQQGGNITDADQHTDPVHDLFLQRIEFDLPEASSHEAFAAEFGELAASLSMTWEMSEATDRLRMAIMVSAEGHCLYDMLGRVAMGELNVDIPVVVSNHTAHRDITERFGVPFVHLPVDPQDKASQQAAVLDALQEAKVDLVIMARYMQILPASIIEAYPHRIINIHHSFLPAFIGAKPYHQAFERGVKLIGGTAHYATVDLDQGPIICQDVTPVSHRDSAERMVARGRDLEQTVLARAVHLHVERRVLSYANRTVIFD